MKIISTLFLILVFACGLSAQDFEYYPVQHMVAEIQDQDFEEFEIKIHTPAPENITFQWEVVSNTLPLGVYPDIDGWSISVCDYTSCYVSIPEDSQSMTPLSSTDMEDGNNAFIKLNLMTMDFVGEGILEIYVYDSNDVNRGDTISFSLSNVNTSIQEVSSASLNIFPNPANVFFNVESSNQDQVVELFDVTGNLIETRVIGSGISRFDVSNCPDGMYFVRLVGANDFQRIMIRK